MSEQRDILQQFGEIILAETKAVSKGFAPTVELEVTEKSMSIKASPYIGTLIHGRAPTRSKGASGQKTLQKVMLEWIERHNITPNEPSMSQEALSWAISKSIHMNGTRLYQQGGGANIFDEILNEQRINSIATILQDSAGTALAESVFKNIKV